MAPEGTRDQDSGWPWGHVEELDMPTLPLCLVRSSFPVALPPLPSGSAQRHRPWGGTGGRAASGMGL